MKSTLVHQLVEEESKLNAWRRLLLFVLRLQRQSTQDEKNSLPTCGAKSIRLRKNRETIRLTDKRETTLLALTFEDVAASDAAWMGLGLFSSRPCTCISWRAKGMLRDNARRPASPIMFPVRSNRRSRRGASATISANMMAPYMHTNQEQNTIKAALQLLIWEIQGRTHEKI